ncbi:uncharacterized protein LOC112682550 [Sipha flava]|uniref:Uncharacterized protein LOC112682550 n=1 Tax=Sipha flava TaxID=143950 RepID=A0A8B8FF33_9HEMI|nr:uncharacterized protein LOC112682550 [Sipha flava]
MDCQKNKYNISVVIKPRIGPIPESVHRLPDIEGLTQDEMNRKSTSDRRKRRIAHVPKYPPIIKKPVIPLSEEPKKKNATKKSVKPAVPKETKKKEIILASSELNKYMAQPIKVRTIPTVDVPWAYQGPSNSRDNPLFLYVHNH